MLQSAVADTSSDLLSEEVLEVAEDSQVIAEPHQQRNVRPSESTYLFGMSCKLAADNTRGPCQYVTLNDETNKYTCSVYFVLLCQ